MTETEMTLEETLEKLAVLREQEKDMNEAVVEAREAMWSTPEGQEFLKLKEKASTLTDLIKETYQRARTLTVSAYQSNGDKRPAPGASIRVYRGKAEISDRGAALTFAKHNMPIAVIEDVDEKALLAWAKTQDIPPKWVEVSPDRPVAAISKDLSQYLDAD